MQQLKSQSKRIFIFLQRGLGYTKEKSRYKHTHYNSDTVEKNNLESNTKMY